MALLTPKDIREHTFQTVRFKEGYDVDEVDDFLDQVTETVEALGKQAVAGGQATQSLARMSQDSIPRFPVECSDPVPAAGERDAEVRLRAGSWCGRPGR